MVVMKELEADYVLKGVGAPRYYLGGNVVQLDEQWEQEGIYTALSAETYITNVIPKLAGMCDLTEFQKRNVFFSEEYHAETDTTNLAPQRRFPNIGH